MSTDTQNNAPVSAEPVAVPDAILLMAQRIAADDFEHCTSDPIFTVEKRNLITGLDLDYTDNIGWFCEGEQIDDEDAAVLEAAYQESGNVPDNYTRTGIEETWEHFATYVTLEAAREFVSKKGDQYRVYVDSGCRNHEWKALRAFLLQIAAKPVLAAPVAAQPDLTQQDATLHAEVLDMVRMLEANEWADHCGKSELGQRLEWAITALQNRPQNIPEIIPESAQQDAETGETVLVKNQELIEPAIEQDGYGWDGGENPPNMVLYQCMAPFHLNLCRGQELRAVIDYGRLVWQQAKQDASKVVAEPDMFWNADNPEQCQDSIINLLVEVQCDRTLRVGDVVEVQRAMSLPNVSVRITGVDSEDGDGDLEYEIINDAARKEPRQ